MGAIVRCYRDLASVVVGRAASSPRRLSPPVAAYPKRIMFLSLRVVVGMKTAACRRRSRVMNRREERKSDRMAGVLSSNALMASWRWTPEAWRRASSDLLAARARSIRRSWKWNRMPEMYFLITFGALIVALAANQDCHRAKRTLSIAVSSHGWIPLSVQKASQWFFAVAYWWDATELADSNLSRANSASLAMAGWGSEPSLQAG